MLIKLAFVIYGSFLVFVEARQKTKTGVFFLALAFVVDQKDVFKSTPSIYGMLLLVFVIILMLRTGLQGKKT